MTTVNTAIVIPTRHRPEMLRRCLRNIVPYVSEHPECMIIVSDDGNSAETAGLLSSEFSSVRVIQGPGRGPSANRNHGAANSSGDLLIFLDDDCTPEMNLVAEYQRVALADPDCGVFEGRITAVGESTSFADSVPANETGGHLWSCNFAIRRDLFVSIGGFDERFPFASTEDIDLRFRLKSRARTLFVPEARVFHAVERRPEWRLRRHAALSFLVYAHLHGLKEIGNGPVQTGRLGVQLALSYLKRLVRRRASRDPQCAAMAIWMNVLALCIMVFWRFRAPMARILFPPCCSGCRSIHKTLSEPIIFNEIHQQQEPVSVSCPLDDLHDGTG